MKALRTILLLIGTISVARSATVESSAAPADNAAQASEYDYEFDNAAAPNSEEPQEPQEPHEPQESASHFDAYISDVQKAAAPKKKGYSRGSGLRTIAVGSANQAKTALNNQAAAGHQAAYVAKNRLAQSAAQSSATAQAALAGKQVILSGLEQQVRDAKVGLQGEEMQLQQAKRAAQAAAQAAQQAMHQVAVIQAALNAAQATSENANEAASAAAGELGAQTAMVGAARQRLHTLQEQLHGVRLDFEATQAAARKAQNAAQQAQANAAEAAAKAAAAGLGGGGGGHGHGHHDHEALVEGTPYDFTAGAPTGLEEVEAEAELPEEPLTITINHRPPKETKFSYYTSESKTISPHYSTSESKTKTPYYTSETKTKTPYYTSETKTRAPSKVAPSLAPVKVTQSAVKTQSLVKVNQTPVKSVPAPVKVVQTPVKLVQVPLRAVQAPVKASFSTHITHALPMLGPVRAYWNSAIKQKRQLTEQEKLYYKILNNNKFRY